MATTEKPASRVAFLRDRVRVASEARGRTTFSVPFRQKQLPLVVIEVPIGFPLYNVTSGRTHRAQSAYVDRHALPADFFDASEDPDVQRAQHEILLELVDERNLAQDLMARTQRNPIVLTYDGFIVDGNRRVAALKREGNVEYVNAVVLPEDATVAEVYETEVEFQMAAETKAPYNWIDEALHVRLGVERLYEKKRPEEALGTVAQHMNMADDDVKFILDRLSLVDLYLAWLGQPNKYHLIPTERGGAAEQAFRDLAERVRQQQFQRMPRQQQRAIREACFAAIASGGGYKDVRRIADVMRRSPGEFIDRVRPGLPDDLQKALDEEPPEQTVDDGPVEELFGQLARAEETAGDSGPASAVINVVGDPDNGKRSGPALIQAAVELEEEQKERKQEPDVQIGRALTIIRGLELTSQTRNLDEIAKAIHEMLEIAEGLVRRVEELRSDDE
jgi:hypothetical protein